jgi:hypothetical protein
MPKRISPPSVSRRDDFDVGTIRPAVTSAGRLFLFGGLQTGRASPISSLEIGFDTIRAAVPRNRPGSPSQP